MNRQRSLLRASILSLSLSVAAGVSAEATSSPAKPKAAAAAKPTAEKSASIAGKYKFGDAKAEKSARQKAVDTVLYSFDESIRMVAQEKLEAKTHVPLWIDIKVKGSKTTIHAEGRNPEVYSLEGPTDGKDPDGNPAELRLAKEGNSYVQTVTTSEGKRVNTYFPQADGSLKVNCELHSPRFPAPIKYTLTYTKAAK